ncbi:unnamed protein product [Amoebophrya sp. A120]|nr:unnamed protein product [Amoebophrya sp. A120]|eukprot:GSA120T00019607001.1
MCVRGRAVAGVARPCPFLYLCSSRLPMFAPGCSSLSAACLFVIALLLFAGVRCSYKVAPFPASSRSVSQKKKSVEDQHT